MADTLADSGMHTPIASGSAPRTRRAGPQLLDDEILAPEFLIPGAPSRNGGRLLTDDRDPWTHNAWDKVEWDEEQEARALDRIEKQAADRVPDELRDQYNASPAKYWDEFYSRVKDGFFNDRAWLRTEFPELAAAVQADAGPKTLVEIGCGPGNTLFPLFAANENPHLKLHGLDYSKEAVELVKSNPAFNPAFLRSQVWDLSSKAGLPSSIEPGTVDIAVMIFVMSALHPDEWDQAVQNVWTMLKPGGILLFRDYGRHDMAQLRFKSARYMQPNLYVRGDHTRVFFFERDELVHLFGDTGTPSTANTASPSNPAELPPSLDSLSLESTDLTATQPLSDEATLEEKPFRFELLQLGVDRRLLLNRKKQLKMYRVWLQGRWRKPLNTSS